METLDCPKGFQNNEEVELATSLFTFVIPKRQSPSELMLASYLGAIVQ